MKEYSKISAKLFGQLLAAYRKKNGFTQQMIADYIGSERSTYAKYETGRKPEIDVLAKLCTLYGVTADEFLSVFEDEQKSVISPTARLNAPKPEEKEGKIVLISSEEAQLLEIYRKSIRKDDIIDYAKTVLYEENNEE